ncbi:hypothetical protein [Trebonia sp.]|uniref:hypothetical protein n=1 Tax=Trebonia sp. TaxID=2767075 RepID=UPI00260DB3BC|nr:hypothetical protein [Trebonia sp.]
MGQVLRAVSGTRAYQDAGTLQDIALRLEYMVSQITPEEFGWQDANYDRDSALGRELLFLIADNQWVRATSETIDITRSDAVDTTIRIDVDLDRITHEAFRGRVGQLWLPVLVLPPLHRRLPEPDPFSTLTVTDASGSPLVTLPGADVRHRVAAALTEIILNVQAWLPDAGDRGFSATRDHRLLLSAAIYRLLRSEHVPTNVLERKVPPRQAAEGHLPRIGRVRRELGELLADYSSLLARPATQNGDSAARDAASARRLTERAVMVLRAFAEAAIVVVLADRTHTPTVLTVTVPGRALHQAPERAAELAGPVTASARRWAGPGLRRWLHPTNWVLPRASLQIDLLLPSADADRLVQVNLPEGVSPDPSRPVNTRAELEVRTEQPRPIRQLSDLVAQLAGAGQDWPTPLSQSLADLAGAKAAAVRESLRDHRVGVAHGMPAITRKESTTRTREFRQRLDRLGLVLGDVSAAGLTPAARRELGDAWGSQDSQGPGGWLEVPMQRRTATETVNPDIVVARSRMIEDATQRATPTEARMQVHIAVTDSEYFSTSQFSGWMSVLLMTVVLAFFIAARALAQDVGGTQVSAEVLAFVLTLFSAIQVGRIERPDRSTVRGMLAPAGNPLIIASILPTVILAVALAFSRDADWGITWTGTCIGAQLVLLRLWLLMRRRALARGRQQTADRELPGGLTLYTDTPDYAHTDVLRSGWWRNTTADALMVGRQAYGYVVWQHAAPQTLRSLLQGGRPVTPANEQASWMPDWVRNGRALLRDRLQGARQAADGSSGAYPDDDSAAGNSVAGTSPLEHPANVLALQRSSTGGQSLTFAVFRDEPKADWQPAEVIKVALDPGRLAPADDVSGVIGVYIGLGRGQGLLPVSAHPVTMMLRAAARRRVTVLEVQLPLPAPEAAYTDLQWARVQLGLQDGDIKRLTPLLNDIHDLAAPASGRPHAGHHYPAANGTPPPALVIGVQTVAEGIPRILNPRPAVANPGPAAEQAETMTGSALLVLASDLDVIASSGIDKTESAAAKTWRVMAICTDWHVGVESEILSRLDPDLGLAGLTATTLHGKAVLLLLAHRTNHAGDPDPARPAGHTGHTGHTGDDPVYLDKWQSRLDLGLAGRHPLLRVHMRTPDRPGATLEVLESLREALRDMAPESLGERDWNVWYARVAVAHGNTGQIQLTVRLAADPAMTLTAGKSITQWGMREFSKIERQALAAAARKMAAAKAAAGSSDSGLYAPEDTVISVGLVNTVDLARPPGERGRGREAHARQP